MVGVLKAFACDDEKVMFCCGGGGVGVVAGMVGSIGGGRLNASNVSHMVVAFDLAMMAGGVLNGFMLRGEATGLNVFGGVCCGGCCCMYKSNIGIYNSSLYY